MDKNKEYHITWSIDIDADSPREAAELALKIQRDTESLATWFSVNDELINLADFGDGDG